MRASRFVPQVALIAQAFTASVWAHEWCDTHTIWAKRARLLGRQEAVGVCPTEGPCDLPTLRDAYIPAQSTPFKTIHLHFVILREDNGTNSAAEEEQIIAQLAQLSSDFAPHQIRFVGGWHWVNSSAFRQLTEAEIDPMKQAHARDVGHNCNIFVTDLSAIGILGRGTFPWDPVALTELGGLIIDDGAFGASNKTLTHEVGHCLGLWHTHRGVSELGPACDPNPCLCACYERADGLDADLTGDFAAETPPTPVNYGCTPPGGTDPCSSTPWGATQPENYMSYAPDSCYSLFAAQQAGRMHCWIDRELRCWLTGTWGDEYNITASDGALDDRFGYSVSISGDTAIVGACENGGAAYVFARSDGAWTQQQKLIASDAAAGDLFGHAVSISDDTALVGAYADAEMRGSAYVFVRSGGVWSEQQKIIASDGALGDRFGYSVSISGDTAIVGAFLDNAPAEDSGSAYVFARSGGVWTQQQKLVASDGTQNDHFGISACVSGETAIVGANVDNEARGSAYVFVRLGGVWSQQEKLTASDGAQNDHFGISACISGDTAVVGAKNNNNGRGAAYVFERSGIVWAQQQKLVASDGAVGDEFGYSVSISSDIAIFGAYNDDAPAAASGSAYVFVRSDGSWTQQKRLTASDGASNDRFGHSVSISGDTSIVGALWDDGAAINSGSAYLYRVLPLVPGDINSDGAVNAQDLLAVIREWGPCPPPCPGDVNQDGIVNVADLLTTITNWG